MQFAIQRLSSPGSSPKQQFVVICEHHHLFVGGYTECEDWLDAHDLLNGADDSCPAVSSIRMAVGRRWVHFERWVRSFFRDNAGHCAAAEAVLLALVLGGFSIAATCCIATCLQGATKQAGEAVRSHVFQESRPGQDASRAESGDLFCDELRPTLSSHSKTAYRRSEGASGTNALSHR
jgi:hypothetical protein